MNKKQVGAIVAGLGIAGAMGVRVYSQWKLLKTDEIEIEEDSNTDEEQFDLDEMLNETEEKDGETKDDVVEEDVVFDFEKAVESLKDTDIVDETAEEDEEEKSDIDSDEKKK